MIHPYATIVDMRDGTPCCFHYWQRGPEGTRAARAKVLGTSEYRVVPEAHIKPLVSEVTMRRKRRRAAQSKACP